MGNRNIFVDALAILFGISSWIGVTSIFLQLPLIVSTAPEGWSLPSYIAITVQMGNIGSFAYVLYQKYSPKKIDDGLLIYIALLIGCVAAICMAFFYQVTFAIDGNTQYSVALLMFTLLFALVGCVSSVLFMPYMGEPICLKQRTDSTLFKSFNTNKLVWVLQQVDSANATSFHTCWGWV